MSPVQCDDAVNNYILVGHDTYDSDGVTEFVHIVSVSP